MYIVWATHFLITYGTGDTGVSHTCHLISTFHTLYCHVYMPKTLINNPFQQNYSNQQAQSENSNLIRRKPIRQLILRTRCLLATLVIKYSINTPVRHSRLTVIYIYMDSSPSSSQEVVSYVYQVAHLQLRDDLSTPSWPRLSVLT